MTLFVFGVGLAFLIVGIYARNKENILLASIGLGVAALLLIIGKKAKHRLEFGVIVISITGYLIQTYRNDKDYFTRNTPAELFYSGYAFALAHQILLSRITHYYNILLFDIGIFIGRTVIYGAGRDPFNFIMQCIFDVVAVYLLYDREKSDRMTFVEMFKYRTEFAKFKEFITRDVPEAIFIIDSKRNTIFSNKSYEKKFHKIPEAQRNKILEHIAIEKKSIEYNEKFLPGIEIAENLYELISIMNEMKVPKEEPVSFQGRFEHHDLKYVFTAKVIPIDWDKEEGYGIILTDITFYENVIRLKLAENYKDKVIASISHELRTPINILMGIIQIMDKDLGAKVANFTILLRNNCELLLGVVNSIIDLQALQNKKIRLNPERFGLHELTMQVRSIFEYQCKQKNLKFELDIDEDAPESLYTDLKRLFQILILLLSNAVKFTQTGQVTLKIQHDPSPPGFLKFTVIDTGIGITDDEKKHLFKLYSPEKGAAGVSKNGVGLGLTLSNALVKLMNFRDEGIEIDSVKGKGTTINFKVSKFYIAPKGSGQVGEEENIINKAHVRPTGEIKLMPTSKTFETVSNSTNPLLTTHNLALPPEDHKNVLLVDDNPFNLMVVEHFLKETGFKTQIATNGEEAIVKALQNQDDGTAFCIIFMDLQMPIMDGFESTKILKKHMKEGRLYDCPIVALSANDTEDDKKRCEDAGMVAHLAKPLKQKDLNVILEKYVKKNDLYNQGS